jgi:uncharacterized protein YnzC (UPF0291/DUF896 family)
MEVESTKSRGVYKSEIFERYALWKYLPSQLRGQPKDTIERMGIIDEDILLLFEIKNQKEFADKFQLGDEGTLSDWNKRLLKESSMQYIRHWSKYLDGNVVFAHYKKILKDPTGNDTKNWFEINENY